MRTLQTGTFCHVSDDVCPSSLCKIIQEKQAAMVGLEREVQRLTHVMSTRTSGVEKREHPLEPVMHIVDDRGTRGTSIGRNASMVSLNSIAIAAKVCGIPVYDFEIIF